MLFENLEKILLLLKIEHKNIEYIKAYWSIQKIGWQNKVTYKNEKQTMNLANSKMFSISSR